MSAAGGAIADAFARCRAERRAAFIPFLMAGDPDLETTERLLAALAEGGANLIELGVPFSDPIADGPVNQRAAARALAAGTTLSGVLELVARNRDRLTFTLSMEEATAGSEFLFICVGTPPTPSGDANLAAIWSVIEELPADIGPGDYIEIGMMGAYGCAMRTGFNGFGVTGSEIVADEPMASLYMPLGRTRRSNVVKL